MCFIIILFKYIIHLLHICELITSIYNNMTKQITHYYYIWSSRLAMIVSSMIPPFSLRIRHKTLCPDFLSKKVELIYMCTCKLSCWKSLYKFDSIFTIHFNLSHMGHIKQSTRFTTIQMFFQHTKWILYRHLISSKWHHFSF